MLASCSIGLSPLARGTRAGRHGNKGPRRFIPAGAGNTTTSTVTRNLRPVYPRWRGEHRRCRSGADFRGGLSPLARGTRQEITSSLAGGRFIPAGAGNTFGQVVQTAAYPVYPRWRGEHIQPNDVTDGDTGLSPLARGTHGLRWRGQHYNRFIPAGAGNTNSTRGHSATPPVYPRWRGEHG